MEKNQCNSNEGSSQKHTKNFGNEKTIMTDVKKSVLESSKLNLDFFLAMIRYGVQSLKCENSVTKMDDMKGYTSLVRNLEDEKKNFSTEAERHQWNESIKIINNNNVEVNKKIFRVLSYMLFNKEWIHRDFDTEVDQEVFKPTTVTRTPSRSASENQTSIDEFLLELLSFAKIFVEKQVTVQSIRDEGFPEDILSSHPRLCEMKVQLLSEDPAERPTARQLLTSNEVSRGEMNFHQEEVGQLQAENEKLRVENELLRVENARMREKIKELDTEVDVLAWMKVALINYKAENEE